ncbi:MAG: hypothetical protein IPK80_23405 [Nannocystis sp.]|nr:hypothetical protein [Nannocystis sp.]
MRALFCGSGVVFALLLAAGAGSADVPPGKGGCSIAEGGSPVAIAGLLLGAAALRRRRGGAD